MTLFLFFVFISGCSSSYLKLYKSSHWNSEVSPEVMQAWQNYRSYYALVEIIDTYIHPMRCQQTGCNKATKKEVLKYLGPGENDPENGHPNSGPNLWIYSSARKIPFDSYIMISFDEAGRVSDIGSCSE